MRGVDMNAETDFISPERVSEEECEGQRSLILSRHILHSLPEAILILNQNLQIVYCNSVLSHILDLHDHEIIGRRPGEAFNCMNHKTGQLDCGSYSVCRKCGLIKSILLSNLGTPNQRECTLKLKKGLEERSLEVKITSVPVIANQENFTVLTLKDVTLQKRKNDLQETFVHDILNKIFILSNNIDNIIKGYIPLDSKCMDHLYALAEKALKVVQDHRALMKSETPSPSIENSIVNIPLFMSRLHNIFSQSSLVQDKNLLLLPCPEKALATDPVLLERALENLIKNALEASEKAQVVTMGYDEEKKVFFVHNEQVLPPDVQEKLFKCPVSTKGTDRGMGLYSVKFIVEVLLKGQVSFVTDEGRGTTFYVKLNAEPENGF